MADRRIQYIIFPYAVPRSITLCCALQYKTPNEAMTQGLDPAHTYARQYFFLRWSCLPSAP